MKITCSPTDPECTGIDINATDGPARPILSTTLLASQCLPWLSTHPSDAFAALRILTRPVSPLHLPPHSCLSPFTANTLEHAIWNSSVYLDLIQSRAGGCAALLSDPWRLIMQTPSDGGPFCSLALSRHGTVVKGLYVHSSTVFDPTAMMKREIIPSEWRATGLQIISLPLAIARSHGAYVTQKLDAAATELSIIENTLASPMQHPSITHAVSIRSLSGLGTLLMDLERRSAFQEQVLTAIEAFWATNRQGTLPAAPLAPFRSQRDTWAYDLSTLPSRLANARSTIAALISQQNERAQLEVAASSQLIAEATLSESHSMRTIAIITMIFLPATAVATFFSMAMFNWNSGNGGGLASHWLWIYFVVTIPLTGLVMAAWWRWSGRPQGRVSAVESDVEMAANVPLLKVVSPSSAYS